MARNPKSKALRVLTGKKAITQANLVKAVPLTGPFDAPAEFNDVQRAAWNRTIDDLRMIGVTTADAGIMESYCCALIQMRKVEEELRKIERKKSFLDSVIIKGAQSAFVVNPLVTMIRNLRTEVVAYAVQLGLTPTSRARMESGALTTAEKKVNLFKKLKDDR